MQVDNNKTSSRSSDLIATGNTEKEGGRDEDAAYSRVVVNKGILPGNTLTHKGTFNSNVYTDSLSASNLYGGCEWLG